MNQAIIMYFYKLEQMLVIVLCFLGWVGAYSFYIDTRFSQESYLDWSRLVYELPSEPSIEGNIYERRGGR